MKLMDTTQMVRNNRITWSLLQYSTPTRMLGSLLSLAGVDVPFQVEGIQQMPKLSYFIRWSSTTSKSISPEIPISLLLVDILQFTSLQFNTIQYFPVAEVGAKFVLLPNIPHFRWPLWGYWRSLQTANVMIPFHEFTLQDHSEHLIHWTLLIISS